MDLATEFEVGKKAVSMICNTSNWGKSEKIAEGIIDGLRCEHRTLQADFWRAIQLAAIQYAEFNSDLRNKAAVEMCWVIKNDGKGIPRI